PIKRRETPDRAALLVGGLRKRLGTEQLERAGKCIAERRGLEARPGPRRLEQAPAPLDLLFQFLLALTRGLELFCSDALLLGINISLLYLAGELIGVPVANALAESAFDVVVDHLRKAAEFFLDGLGFLDEYLKHPVLHALRQNEVVTAHL